MNWRTEGDADMYVDVFHEAEKHYCLPTDLLFRIAYQESRFRQDIINGQTKSPVGAVGIMQLMPRYFPGAGHSIAVDINTAAAFLASLFRRFSDWQLAVAAYNWGGGNVHHEAIIDGGSKLSHMPKETQDYVTEIFTDVPIPGILFNVGALI